MPSLPMHNAEISVGLMFVHTFQALQESASSEKKHTLMEAVIFTCSYTGNGNFDAEDPMFLMSEVATRTLSEISGIQERLGIMSSRRGASSPGVYSTGRAEQELVRLATCGMTSWMQTIWTSFSVVFGSWIQKHFARAIQHYGHTETTLTLQRLSRTSAQPGSNLHLEQYLTWLDGQHRIWVLQEVSVGGPRRMWGGRFEAKASAPPRSSQASYILEFLRRVSLSLLLM